MECSLTTLCLIGIAHAHFCSEDSLMYSKSELRLRHHYTKIIVVRLCVCLSVSNGRTPETI